jgi:lipopolysaccharide/colanic/teichoic acid biosynthesis glycosyltransferase
MHPKSCERSDMMKRLFDIFFSILILLVALIPFILVALAIAIDSKGGIFFHQVRVGKNGTPFKLHKFRTMRPATEKLGQLTVGNRDPRITSIGFFLRKYKLDELPQLFNILKGEMSVVGPRPEVPKYVALYSKEQLHVLSVRPGLTDFASIDFVDENALLSESKDSERTYIEEIMPLKLKLNLRYVQEISMTTDFKIIIETFGAIFIKKRK